MESTNNNQTQKSQYCEAKRILPYTDFPTKGFYLIKQTFKTEKDGLPVTAAIVEWKPTENSEWVDVLEVKYLTLDYLFDTHCIKPNKTISDLPGCVIQVKAAFKSISLNKVELIVNWNVCDNENTITIQDTDILPEISDEDNTNEFYIQEFDKHEVAMLAEEAESNFIPEAIDLEAELDKQLINEQLQEVESGLFDDAALIAWQAMCVDHGYYDDSVEIESQVMASLEDSAENGDEQQDEENDDDMEDK